MPKRMSDSKNPPLGIAYPSSQRTEWEREVTAASLSHSTLWQLGPAVPKEGCLLVAKKQNSGQEY